MSVPVEALSPVTSGVSPFDTLYRWLLTDAVSRSASVREYRQFYAGQQPNALTPAQKTMLEGLLSEDTTSAADEWAALDNPAGGRKYLCDNRCKVIVDTLQSRLRVKRFQCEDEAVLAALQDVMVFNRLEDQQNDVHRDNARDGNSYLLLGFDNETGRVTVTREPQWVADEAVGLHGAGVHLIYDGAGKPMVGLKEWVERVDQDTNRRRLTLYYPDRIERYAIVIKAGESATGREWEPFSLEGEPGPSIQWIGRDGEPLGIPIVPFKGESDSTHYGVSDLAGSILGLQRATNDALHMGIAGERMTGAQVYAAMGVSVSDAAQWKVGPGQIWGATGGGTTNPSVTAIPGGDMTQIILWCDYLLKVISQNSGIPTHHFTGEWPSGEALIRAENPLVTKIVNRQARFGPSWASVMHKATLLLNAFAGMTLNVDALIATEWEDAALRDEAYRIEVVMAKSQLISREQALRELDYTEEQIAKMMAEVQAQQEFDAEMQLKARPQPAPPAPR